MRFKLVAIFKKCSWIADGEGILAVAGFSIQGREPSIYCHSEHPLNKVKNERDMQHFRNVLRHQI